MDAKAMNKLATKSKVKATEEMHRLLLKSIEDAAKLGKYDVYLNPLLIGKADREWLTDLGYKVFLSAGHDYIIISWG